MNKKLEADLWATLERPHARPAAPLWAEQALKDGRIQSLREVERTLQKWTKEGCYSYLRHLWLGSPVPGSRPQRLENSHNVKR